MGESIPSYVFKPGTYNLKGGLFQTSFIQVNDQGNAVFNFTGGTLQAGSNGLTVGVPLDLTGATSHPPRIDLNGQQVNLQNLTTSSLTEIHFVNPASGSELLTINSGYTLTVNPGTDAQLRH